LFLACILNNIEAFEFLLEYGLVDANEKEPQTQGNILFFILTKRDGVGEGKMMREEKIRLLALALKHGAQDEPDNAKKKPSDYFPKLMEEAIKRAFGDVDKPDTALKVDKVSSVTETASVAAAKPR
jgi:hypothetical protein